MTFSPMPSRIETERLFLTPAEPSDAEWFTGIGTLVLRKRPDGEALGYTAIVVGRGSLDAPEIA